MATDPLSASCLATEYYTTSQVPLPTLSTFGLRGSPFGQIERLVVPVSASQHLPPGALFSLLSGLPDGAPRPTLAIVDSCASVVYMTIDGLPDPPGLLA